MFTVTILRGLMPSLSMAACMFFFHALNLSTDRVQYLLFCRHQRNPPAVGEIPTEVELPARYLGKAPKSDIQTPRQTLGMASYVRGVSVTNLPRRKQYLWRHLPALNWDKEMISKSLYSMPTTVWVQSCFVRLESLPKIHMLIMDTVIEGDNKAILYTGDIRSEPWFVNSLTRNPFLIEYTSGLKSLDCIYLDTSNTRDIPFPTKADGLTELLRKVLRYPADTVFHFTAWTFGYEEVWMALSRALKSQVSPHRFYLVKCKSG
jgi:hypothetical protein